MIAETCGSVDRSYGKLPASSSNSILSYFIDYHEKPIRESASHHPALVNGGCDHYMASAHHSPGAPRRPQPSQAAQVPLHWTGGGRSHQSGGGGAGRSAHL